MNTYHCQNCTLSFTPADKSWEQLVATGCCPKCNKELAKRNIHPLLSDEHSKYWFSTFYKSKYLLVFFAIIIIGSAYPAVWAAYSLPQGQLLLKTTVLLIWAPIYWLLMSYLSSRKVMRLGFSIPFTLLLLALAFYVGKHDPRVASQLTHHSSRTQTLGFNNANLPTKVTIKLQKQ